MADWRRVAAAQGWRCFTASIRVPLGTRRHTVRVVAHDDEVEFYAAVPELHAAALVELLAANRASGLAYWHVEHGLAWATCRCPRTATAKEMAACIRDTAALADRLELRLSETDR